MLFFANNYYINVETGLLIHTDNAINFGLIIGLGFDASARQTWTQNPIVIEVSEL